MKAVGYRKSLPVSDPEALIDFTADRPAPSGRDLLVKVMAVSVNPVDTKVRMRAAPAAGEPPKVLGYDAAGVVEALGPEATLFRPGDGVFTLAPSCRPEPMPNSTWSTSVLSGQSPSHCPSRRPRRCR